MISGLTEKQALENRKKYGSNTISRHKKNSFFINKKKVKNKKRKKSFILITHFF